MEMHQVRYFLAVAQELNFSRAAEKCNVSQPSLSRAIQQLEGELGGPLFNRERHLTHLTDLGEMVRPHMENVYEAAMKAKQLSRDLAQLKSAMFRSPHSRERSSSLRESLAAPFSTGSGILPISRISARWSVLTWRTFTKRP